MSVERRLRLCRDVSFEDRRGLGGGKNARRRWLLEIRPGPVVGELTRRRDCDAEGCHGKGGSVEKKRGETTPGRGVRIERAVSQPSSCTMFSRATDEPWQRARAGAAAARQECAPGRSETAQASIPEHRPLASPTKSCERARLRLCEK
jgi:hypothetical protein